jgi:SAM-dependent methyltransferase
MSSELVKDIIQWDVRTWSKAIPWWERHLPKPHVGKALELGGREGGLSLWLASEGFHVICSDLENTEATAKPLHQKHGVEQNVEYKDIDATNIPFENHFDVIVFKSILGGIGRDNNPEAQQRTFNEIHKALKPGGMLLFAENLSASGMHRYMRKKFVRWGNSWRYVRIDELKAFTSSFQSFEYKTTGFFSAFGRSEFQRNTLALSDEVFFNHVLPSDMNYVLFGCAVK